jgi:hypothetical protein
LQNVTTPLCVQGECDYAECAVPYADCDGNRQNGCERAVDTLTDCGDCDVPCQPANAVSPTCANGTCDHGGCTGSYQDCDGDTANGCESDSLTDDDHCGGCNSPCTPPDVCSGGNCGCVPTGQRAPFNTLSQDTASGCWNGNPCPHDAYAWSNANGQNFQAFGQLIACSGASTCVQNVGICTYSGTPVCQGYWDVLCDGQPVGQIQTIGGGCVGSAMSNGCSISFAPRMCAEITLVAAADGDNTASCCGGTQPDSMIVAVSAW